MTESEMLMRQLPISIRSAASLTLPDATQSTLESIDVDVTLTLRFVRQELHGRTRGSAMWPEEEATIKNAAGKKPIEIDPLRWSMSRTFENSRKF